jgi:hypothetical protein
LPATARRLQQAGQPGEETACSSSNLNDQQHAILNVTLSDDPAAPTSEPDALTSANLPTASGEDTSDPAVGALTPQELGSSSCKRLVKAQPGLTPGMAPMPAERCEDIALNRAAEAGNNNPSSLLRDCLEG